MTNAETPLSDGLILAWPESYTPWSITRLNDIGNEYKEMSDFELYVCKRNTFSIFSLNDCT